MKKIFLFMLASLLILAFSNCSSDPKTESTSTVPPATQSVSAKIDGVQKTFSNVNVTQEPWSDNGVPKVDLNIIAMNPEDDGEAIIFWIGKGDIGEGQLWAFTYIKDGVEYAAGEALTNSTTINIEKRIQGTFTGPVSSGDGSFVLTDGIFDITY